MKRNVNGKQAADPALIANTQYNEKAGAQKQIDVGPKLLPLDYNKATPTTDASTIKSLPSAGRSIAVYNNAGAVGSITFGSDATQVSKAPGVVDTVTKSVGIPCAPNAWSYLSAGEATFVISSAATLLVFLIDDATSLSQQTTR